MTANDGPDGLAVVDKPIGPTSHDVVAMLRRSLHTRRVGHAGTLDPTASGVLLVGVGRVTRLLRFLTALPKTYVGDLVLGTETSTLDAAGTVTATHEMGGTTLDDVAVAAKGFVGDILQVPPMVSAVKVGGRRLHELARAGIEVERAPRPVTVRSITVDATADPLVFRLGVECSSGTYVRTLAADIGHALGGGAHLRDLRRTAIGSFAVADAVEPEAVTQLLSPAQALRDHPSLTVGAAGAELLARSGRLALEGDAPVGDGPFAIVDVSGRLLAVAERRDGGLRPTVVLAGAGSAG